MLFVKSYADPGLECNVFARQTLIKPAGEVQHNEIVRRSETDTTYARVFSTLVCFRRCLAPMRLLLLPMLCYDILYTVLVTSARPSC